MRQNILTISASIRDMTQDMMGVLTGQTLTLIGLDFLNFRRCTVPEPLPDESDEYTVDLITTARARNNRLWMNLLKLAVKHAPEEAKPILREINKNDQDISRWLESLAD